MSDMEVDPHDWLKIKKSRDRAIRLRRASCQRTAWRKLQKEMEDSLRVLALTFRAVLKWSKSVLVTLANVQGLVITAGVGVMLESGRLDESGVTERQGGQVVTEMVTRDGH